MVVIDRQVAIFAAAQWLRIGGDGERAKRYRNTRLGGFPLSSLSLRGTVAISRTGSRACGHSSGPSNTGKSGHGPPGAAIGLRACGKAFGGHWRRLRLLAGGFTAQAGRACGKAGRERDKKKHPVSVAAHGMPCALAFTFHDFQDACNVNEHFPQDAL